MVWIVFGTKEESRRVPGGASVVRECPSCHEVTTFYEKDMTSTLRLYFIDVYDYKKHRVMQCGACGAHYATDEVHAEDKDDAATIGKKLDEGAGAITRAATAIGEEVTHLAAKLVGRPMPKTRARAARDEEPKRTQRSEEPEVDPDDLAALDDMEMKFRKLEAEEEAKKRGGR